MHFTKWHGLGNDFVIINSKTEPISDYRQQALAVCDRNFGIGADGLVVILPSDIADFKMRIFNSDGSEADMCGNATRCVARYLYETGLTDKTTITLDTLAGIITPELIFDQNTLATVKVDMGEPKLTRGETPMTGNAVEKTINAAIEVGGQTYRVTALSMGNPHCVIFVDDVAAVDLAAIGPKIETHALFPRKTNVEFIQVVDRQTLRMRVWERGAGITKACGTGASAALVAAVLNGHTDRQATVKLDGGDLFIHWADNNHIYKSGPAVEVFRGEYLL
ncbi:diaminopimelate epimerase [Sporomusa termitida]|uniref:Diaminopimelate epimerase n=1 Tax=Sporomusa termitida TaxID=2377 RepID=A0A517DTL4_9FIRM|nr:diaminopimelate epimerase [Sporomusa termitida]QDR80687.1 Diaminopimelate epimerase [Sporomusa termitida]